MTTRHLLTKGYFVEELPPPFHTITLGRHHRALQSHLAGLSKEDREKINETLPVLYSTPKMGIYRRITALPNPVHQIGLSEIIASKWEEIRNYWKKSKLSASKPNVKLSEKRAIAQISKYQEFKEKCIAVSYDRQYELKADVSKYFPSIYTHSIPWALHGKKFAKSKIGRFDKTLLGNRLDEAVRWGQSGQTKGIPIGTDTSRIIAEIIGTALDVELIKAFRKDHIDFTGYRFIDDYQLYFKNGSDAEKALKILQKILNDYSLDLSDEKTMINTAPYKIDNDWSYLLNSCPMRSTEERIQAHDLITYVNLLIDTAVKYPADYVIKYGIKRLLKFKVYPDNWPLLEALVLKLGTYEPSVLPLILVFLLENEDEVDTDRIKKFINTLLEQCVARGHSFEVAWCLWIAKSFEIKIALEIAQDIVDSRDVIGILILLDMHANNLIDRRSKLKFAELKLEFTEENLSSELWLLIYEANRKGWIPSTAVAASPYFKKLEELKISFYDSDVEIELGDSNVIREDVEASSTTDDEIAEFLRELGREGASSSRKVRRKKPKVKVESNY